MATRSFAKYVTFCVIFNVIIISLFYHLNWYYSETGSLGLTESNKSSHLKQVLIWTSIKTDPFKYFGEGTNGFINKRCSFTNCYVSSNRRLLKEADVILFHGPELKNVKPSFLPRLRSPRQKYVFASMESSAYYPICDKMFNNYFNWTYTYKFNSDEYFGYISIRDKEGKVIGPRKEMHWQKVEAMRPINDTLKAKLSTKKLAAAWFVSNCRALSGRNKVAAELKTELAKYKMQVDIFGKCGTLKCPKDNMTECLLKLETDYYFYLSFENSFAEDYVTEKLLHALNHYAIPVVYGGANYTRFMPDGIYLNAQKSRIKELAKEMVDIINDKQKYYEFFKWHNHYTYHWLTESPDTDAFCKFCALVNNEEKVLRTSVYDDFSKWWNPKQYKCP